MKKLQKHVLVISDIAIFTFFGSLIFQIANNCIGDCKKSLFVIQYQLTSKIFIPRNYLFDGRSLE